MAEKSLDDLGQLQRAVIETIWDLDQASVHQVSEQLSKKKKKNLAYTTILTTMQKLEKTGWLTHQKQGKSYIYLPTRTRKQASDKSVRKFIKEIFNGNTMLMFQHLMDQSNLSEQEFKELQKIIENKRKGNKK